MRCIICDNCGAMIKDPKTARIITCSRPMKKTASKDDPANDIVWQKELCIPCATELEAYITSGADNTDTDG